MAHAQIDDVIPIIKGQHLHTPLSSIAVELLDQHVNKTMPNAITNSQWNILGFVIEIITVHVCIVLGGKFLWSYLSLYLPDVQPLLNLVWSYVLEPYAVSLFSVPSVVAFLIILYYTAAKNFARDIFNAEGIMVLV